MRASRLSSSNHWRAVGRACRNMGWSVDKALTGKPAVDAWILEGYRSK